MIGDGSGRYLAMSFNLNNTFINVFSWYFPCFSTSPSYGADLGLHLGLIEDIISSSSCTDYYFRWYVLCVKSHNGFVQSQIFLNVYSIHNCDHICSTGDGSMYNNVNLGKFSFIDHVFIFNFQLQFIDV